MDRAKTAPSANEDSPGGLLGYAEFVSELKQWIATARLQSALTFNRELILLYWASGVTSSRGNEAKVGAPGSSLVSRTISAGPFPR
jgi:hypothetical protein